MFLRRPPKFFAEFLFAALCLALFLGTWRHWVEYWGDAGYNLYSFWQIAEGKLLYKEITYLHGPLSISFNAWIFRLFGASILHLAVVNLFFTWLLTCLIFRMLSRIAGGLIAGLAAVYFLTGFAFAHITDALSFNYIVPYRPEVTHGLLIAFSAFYFFSRWQAERRKRDLFTVGFLWGCSLLLSMETCVALFAGLGFASVLSLPQLKRDIGTLLCGFLSPLLLSTALFCRALPLHEAFRSTFKMLEFAAEAPSVYKFPFYQRVLGLDQPIENLKNILFVSFSVLFVLCALFLGSKFTKRIKDERIIYGGTSVIALFFIFPVFPFPFSTLWWAPYGKALPLFTLLFCGLALGDFFFRKSGKAAQNHAIFLLGFLAFSLALLSKMLLNPRVGHYGAFLGMPAAILLVVFFCQDLPERLGSRGGDPRLFRGFFLAAIAGIAVSHWFLTLGNGKSTTFLVGRDGDRGFTYGDPHFSDDDQILASAVRWVEENIRPQEKLQMLPDGDIINYLARRARPLPYNGGALFYRQLGELSILGDLRASAPEYIGLVSSNEGDFGMGVFGRDPNYGVQIRQWLEENYQVAHAIGTSPLENGNGVVFFRRKKSLL